jgi:hypothetical protein
MQQKNEEDWKSQKAVLYISKLKTALDQNILRSNCYASFLGSLVNIKTMIELFSYIVKTGDLKGTLTCTRFLTSVFFIKSTHLVP